MAEFIPSENICIVRGCYRGSPQSSWSAATKECGSGAYPGSSWSRNREWKAIPGGEKMQTKEAIKFALTVSNGAVLSVIDEMSGAATTFPTPNGGGQPPLGLAPFTLFYGTHPATLFRGQNSPPERQQ